MEKEQLDMYRHSMAHILAKALQELYGKKLKLTIGPSIENGFYYDIDFDKSITPDDFALIESKMKEIIKRQEDFVRKEVSKKQAKELFADNKYREQSGVYDIERYGTIEWEWDYTDEEQGIKEWSFYLDASRDITYLYFQLAPINVEINSVSEGSGFGMVTSGDYVFLESTSGISSGERVLLFTVITRDLEGADEECELSLVPQNLNCNTNIDGYYFDNDDSEHFDNTYEKIEDYYDKQH